MSKAFSAFDISFKEGMVGEELAEYLVGKTAEVKTDYVYARTGNFYVEFQSWNNTQNKMIPSGIETTESNYYCFVITKGQRPPLMLWVPTQLVKKLVKDCKEVDMMSGANPTKGYLLKASQVFGAVIEAA
jgi:hypothetical protein